MKTLSPSLTLILLSILALTSFLPLTSCSDDNSQPEGIGCEEPSAIFNLEVTGSLGSSLITVNGGEFYRPFFATEWQGMDSDSISKESIALLKKRLSDGTVCILMPSDYQSPFEEGEDFTLKMQVQYIGESKGRFDFLFVDYVKGDICGTPDPKYPIIYGSRASSIYDKMINVYVHVVRSSSGVGLNKETFANKVITTLNRYFSTARIEFNLLGSEYWDVMTDSWANSFSLFNSSDRDKIFSYNSHSNAVDVYVISNLKSNINGYSIDIPGTAYILKDIGLESSTIAHEMGHCLGLSHTHAVTENLDLLDPCSENVDGTNGEFAGDCVKDTPADPNIWSGGVYVGGNLVDRNGMRYNPDPENLMSYSGGIRVYFTPGQIQRMHDAIAGTEILQNFLTQKKLDSNFHFSNSKELNIIGLTKSEEVQWRVGVVPVLLQISAIQRLLHGV